MKFYSIIFFLLTSLITYSQSISNYGFSPSTGTFTALSGATNPALSGGNVDDGFFNNIPLGFTFVYMDVPYTSISASTNGWITFGSAITNSTFTNDVSAGGAPRPVVAALWDDIDVQVATNVSYLTTGTAGNRIFTIQYLNTQWDYLATGNTMSFQIKLFETTGVIQFIYRQESGAINNPSASIGITASGTGSGNFKCLNNSGASPTASTTVATNTIATKPATGQIYTWTPPVTSPNAPTNLTFSNIASTSYTINWTDASNEQAYNIYRSTDGINYTFIQQVAANTTTFAATGLTAATMYYWNVFSSNEGRFSVPLNGEQPTLTAFTFTSSGSIAIPCGVTNVLVEAWGAGGGGGNSNNGSGKGGAGGGGGAFASGSHTVSSGSTYFYSVGNGGLGAPAGTTNPATNGGDTWFNAIANTNAAPTLNTNGTFADGGNFGPNAANSGTNRGSAAASLGNIATNNGTNGGNGTNAGGGNGGNAGNGGGTGGAGSTTSNGTAGNPPGGAGGGSNDNGAHKGGDGARGEIRIYYPVYVANVAPSSASASVSTGCVTPYSTTLTQSGGTLGTNATWYWYSGSCGGTLVGTSRAANAALTITVNANTTYFVRAEGGSCSSTTSCASVSVTLNQLPTASAGSVISAFVGEYNTVSGATATNGTILWTHNGTGYFDETYFPVGNPTTTTPTYYTEEGDFGQTVTLTMTVTGLGACSSSSATANYTINVDGRPALWTYQCGTTLADINDYVYAYAVPGATQYRFRINNGASQTFTTPASVFYFTQFPSYSYGSTYTCDVAAFVGGAWTAFGPTCSISTPSLPITKIQTSQCGVTLAALNTPIYADLIEGATQYRFRVTNGGPVQTFDNPSRMFNLSQFIGNAYNTSYTIDVAVFFGGAWQPFGSTCIVSTPASAPTTTIIASQCGITVANLDVDLYADEVSGATQYRFRATNGSSITVDKPSRTFKFSQMSGILAGTTYSVDVAAFVNGSWGPFGSTCNVSTPAAGLTQLIPAQCGVSITDIFTDLFANNVTGATQYRFRVSNGLGTQTIIKPSRTFKLSQLSNVQYGSVNTIDVDVFVGGAWLGYGPTCTITTPATPSTKIMASQCGDTVASIYSYVYADEVPSATQYRFRINNAQTIVRTSRFFQMSLITGLVVDSAYNVDVDAFVAGAWVGYGAVCQVRSPGVLALTKQDYSSLENNQLILESTPESLGINENSSELNFEIIAFPNPFKTDFEIAFKSKDEDDIVIQIFDALGKEIENHKIQISELKNQRFGSDYTSGIYFIHLKQNENNQIIKVVKN